MTKTKIEWADEVWNPVTGCTKVSEGCRHCYAERIANRFWGERKFTDVQMHMERMDDPLRWKKPRKIFVNSMSDLFHDSVSVEFIANVWTVMRLNDQHRYMILTKRPKRMFEVLTSEEFAREYRDNLSFFTDGSLKGALPLKNVWLGVSVETQKEAGQRIPSLLETPAEVRFISAEPLLGSIDLWMFAKREETFGSMYDHRGTYPFYQALGWPDKPVKISEGIDWVICGGESGPGARPMHPDWARSLRDQCQAAGVPFFFKQWGEWEPFGAPIVAGTYNGAGIFLRHDGTFGNQGDYWNSNAIGMDRVGKKMAGRLLDGCEWNEEPQRG